ncbi:unnamed protein product [Prunus armeniaca]
MWLNLILSQAYTFFFRNVEGQGTHSPRWGWRIPDMNIAGMNAGMKEKSLTGTEMGMAYPPPIQPIAIPTSKASLIESYIRDDQFARTLIVWKFRLDLGGRVGSRKDL